MPAASICGNFVAELHSSKKTLGKRDC